MRVSPFRKRWATQENPERASTPQQLSQSGRAILSYEDLDEVTRQIEAVCGTAGRGAEHPCIAAALPARR
jgi:hypothetical protein